MKKPPDVISVDRYRELPTKEQRLANYINLMIWSFKHNDDYLFKRSSEKVDSLIQELEDRLCL